MEINSLFVRGGGTGYIASCTFLQLSEQLLQPTDAMNYICGQTFIKTHLFNLKQDKSCPISENFQVFHKKFKEFIYWDQNNLLNNHLVQ